MPLSPAYLPRHVPQRCFLMEAVSYRLAFDIPAATSSECEGDPTFDRSAQPQIGLEFREVQKPRYPEQLHDGREFGIGQLPSVVALERHITQAKAEIISEICRGRLPAYGRRTKRLKNYEYWKDFLLQPASDDELEIYVSPDAFDLQRVLWRHSVIWDHHGKFGYYHVKIDVEKLFEIYPLPEGQHDDYKRFRQGKIPSLTQETTKKRRGAREKFNWPALKGYATQRLKQVRPPYSMATFIADLHTWHEKKFPGRSLPSESVIRLRLKPLFDEWRLARSSSGSR